MKTLVSTPEYEDPSHLACLCLTIQTWSLRKKIWTTAYLAAFLFFSPFSSTVFAPAVYLVMDGLHITDNTVGALQVSIFMFAFAVGPPFLAPLSERYGRAIVIHGGNFVFMAFSIGGGFCKTVIDLSHLPQSFTV
jgi:MFS family permease